MQVLSSGDDPKTFEQVARWIVTNVERVCGRGVIDPRWVANEIRTADHLFVDDEQRAFAIAREKRLADGERALYVDLVCATPGHGASAMRAVEAFARRRRFDSVLLAALPAAVNFYRKLGYRPMVSCATGMPVDVEDAWNAAGYHRFATGEHALRHAPTHALFERMIAHQIVPLACSTVDACKWKGFLLRKCFANVRVRVKRPAPRRTKHRRGTGASVARKTNAPIAFPKRANQVARGRDGRTRWVAVRRRNGGSLYWRRAHSTT